MALRGLALLEHLPDLALDDLERREDERRIAVARHRSARRAAAWCAGAFLVLAAHLLTSDAALPGLLGLVPASAWVVVPGTLGALRRLAVEAGARQVAQEQRERLQAERLVIAQEVHDIVGHGLAAIRMQADIALHVRATRPEQAELALAAISRTSADALDELRATLGAIGPLDGEGWPPPRAVTPGLGRISALCERTRSAGVEVDLTTTGLPGPVDPAVDVAAYRVVQECLTNVVKHSAHRHADVRVDQDPGSVTVRVANRLPAGGAGPEGFGIAGMRRRVGEVGGHLSAGPDEDGTFTVTARMPTGPRSDR